MKATFLFTFHSIAALGFGLAFLVFPGFMTELLGVPTNVAGTYGWQFFGLGILTIAFIAFGSRTRPVDEVRYPVMTAFCGVFVAMVLLKFSLVLFSDLTLNIWMWMVVGFHVLMAVWYGYYVFGRRT